MQKSEQLPLQKGPHRILPTNCPEDRQPEFCSGEVIKYPDITYVCTSSGDLTHPKVKEEDYESAILHTGHVYQ